jgi:hypothetical protein
VSDMGPHGIRGGIYRLLHDRQKAVVSSKCAMEPVATYPLLHEREEALIRTVHSGDTGDLRSFPRM